MSGKKRMETLEVKQAVNYIQINHVDDDDQLILTFPELFELQMKVNRLCNMLLRG